MAKDPVTLKVLDELRAAGIVDMWQRQNEREKVRVAALGAEIGFGNLMRLAQACWREAAAAKGYPPGGEHVVGPCAAEVVPCGCESGMCDWCCGAGWVTKHVKAVRDG